MADINAYQNAENYMMFQSLRPDYTKAIKYSLNLAKKYLPTKKDVVIADFCCGTGTNTKAFASMIKGLKKAFLIDINKEFLQTASKSGIEAEQIEVICL